MSEGNSRAARTHIVTLGCKVNRAESERIAAGLLSRGATIVGETDAEVTIVHTCCVTNEAEHKGRKAVRRALRSPGNRRVVVSGCLAALDPSGLAELDDRVEVVRDPSDVPTVVVGASTGPLAERVGGPFRTRVMVKVEDGCDARCAYCIVPQTRGMPRSTPLSDVVEEVQGLARAGVREVVLTGVNLGRWQENEARLPELIDAVTATGVERLRLSSIEPQHLTPRLLDTLGSSPAVCPHLHVPLQSGADAVLAAMGRSYDADGYVAKVEEARRALPGLAVSTDLIAGFPGESERDHGDTVDLIESLRGTVSRLHVFRYSPRPGTSAADRADAVEPEVARARARDLRELGDSLARTYLESRLGEKARVLIEFAGSQCGVGTSEDYLRVVVERADLRLGEVVEATLTRANGSRAVAA